MAESKYTAPNDFRAFCEMLGETETSMCHHGIKGQRWGVRRFQNEDGSLTTAGKKHYSKDKENVVSAIDLKSNKSINDEYMSYRNRDNLGRKDKKIMDSIVNKAYDGEKYGLNPMILSGAHEYPSGSQLANFKTSIKKDPNVHGNIAVIADKKKKMKNVDMDLAVDDGAKLISNGYSNKTEMMNKITARETARLKIIEKQLGKGTMDKNKLLSDIKNASLKKIDVFINEDKNTSNSEATAYFVWPNGWVSSVNYRTNASGKIDIYGTYSGPKSDFED